jgi:DMSO reductase anchor subunit
MISGQKQNDWKLPAVLNLTLGGMGTGFYLIALLLVLPQPANWTLPEVAIIKLLGPVLVGMGLLSLTLEAGNPLNSIYLLTNLRHSWMSREALAGGIFILAAGLDWLMPNPIMQGIAALAGSVFMFAQGMLVWRASGVLTWNTPTVPWFFLTCGLATGSGAILVINGFFNAPSWLSLPFVTMILALLNALAWFVYVNMPGEAFRRGIAPLRRAGHLALTLGVGHALPIALILIALTMSLPTLVPIAGLALIFGGAIQKYTFSFDGGTMRSVI